MATYTTDKIEFGGNVYKLQDSDALPLAGGNVTGPVNFGDSVTMEEASVGDIVITGNASATNNLQANTINGVEVGSTPKFTDTVTTVSTTGSGNAVTAISASNGAITATKGTTFLTSHQDISGKADKSATVSTVAWDSTNKKLTKTINGTTSDVVTAATLRTDLNVADGAEVNQNAFSNVKVGSTTIAADTTTDTIELVAGSNITLTPDATNDKVTITATGGSKGFKTIYITDSELNTKGSVVADISEDTLKLVQSNGISLWSTDSDDIHIENADSGLIFVKGELQDNNQVAYIETAQGIKNFSIDLPYRAGGYQQDMEFIIICTGQNCFLPGEGFFESDNLIAQETGQGKYTIDANTEDYGQVKSSNSLLSVYPSIYRFSGCPSGGSLNTYYLVLKDQNDTVLGIDTGNGVDIDFSNYTLNYDYDFSGHMINVYFEFVTDGSLSLPTIITPMLQLKNFNISNNFSCGRNEAIYQINWSPQNQFETFFGGTIDFTKGAVIFKYDFYGNVADYQPQSYSIDKIGDDFRFTLIPEQLNAARVIWCEASMNDEFLCYPQISSIKFKIDAGQYLDTIFTPTTPDIIVHKPTIFEQGIQPMDSNGITGVEILPTRLSDRLGGRIKLDRGESTARDVYIDTYEDKLRFVDKNPSTAIRATLDMTNGAFGAHDYYYFRDGAYARCYPPEVTSGSVVGSPNTDNVTSWWVQYKYNDYQKMIWVTANYDLGLPTSYGALYFSDPNIALPTSFFSEGYGNLHWIASARSSLGLYSTNVHSWNASTGSVAIFVGSPVKPSSGTWSVQVELWGIKF